MTKNKLRTKAVLRLVSLSHIYKQVNALENYFIPDFNLVTASVMGVNLAPKTEVRNWFGHLVKRRRRGFLSKTRGEIF